MVGVEHAGHPWKVEVIPKNNKTLLLFTVKSEAVEAKVLNPESKVREEKTQGLPVAVVKKPAHWHDVSTDSRRSKHLESQSGCSPFGPE